MATAGVAVFAMAIDLLSWSCTVDRLSLVLLEFKKNPSILGAMIRARLFVSEVA